MSTPRQKPVIWTIGHGLAKPELVRGILDAAGIKAVIDVRSVPYSRRNLPFSKGKLHPLVNSWGMEYLWLGTNLGGLDAHVSQYFEDACDQVAMLARHKPVVLLCSESVWRGCHRDYLLAGPFQKRGFEVVHLLHDGTSAPAPTLEQRVAASHEQPPLF
jgi:uncharacterized protein (DUF488 family)